MNFIWELLITIALAATAVFVLLVIGTVSAGLIVLAGKGFEYLYELICRKETP